MATTPELVQVSLVNPEDTGLTTMLMVDGTYCVCVITTNSWNQVGSVQAAMVTRLPKEHVGTLVTVGRLPEIGFYTLTFTLANTSIKQAIEILELLLGKGLVVYQYRVQDVNEECGLLNAQVGPEPGRITFTLLPNDARSNLGLWRFYGDRIKTESTGWTSIHTRANSVTVVLKDTSGRNLEETLLELACLFTFN